MRKENDYSATKNLQFGVWEPVRNISVPSSISARISTPYPFQKAAMPDVEANESKTTIEKRKHPRIINVLKKSVGAMTITNHILD